jgi:hypothetical protein
MTGLMALWLPILLSAVIVFVVSSVIHMMTPWHKGDYPKVPNEDKVRDALRPLAIPPGDYMIPRPSSSKEMSAPEFLEKLKQGPVLIMTVLPNQLLSMGKSLTMWFLYSLVVALLAAYVTGRALPAGAEYMKVFQLASTTAFTGYSVGIWQMWIWYHRDLGTTVRSTIDGLIYALLTGGTFGWLWPN